MACRAIIILEYKLEMNLFPCRGSIIKSIQCICVYFLFIACQKHIATKQSRTQKNMRHQSTTHARQSRLNYGRCSRHTSGPGTVKIPKKFSF
jgi:hypothetical protein